jgi:DnaK suppressor protein
MNIDIEKQKRNLLVEKDMLIIELRGLGVLDKINDEFVPKSETSHESVSDDDEQADIFEELQINAGTGEVLQERLVDVEDALKKIEAGTYGICEITGSAIEVDRLIANPAARTCKAAMNQG